MFFMTSPDPPRLTFVRTGVVQKRATRPQSASSVESAIDKRAARDRFTADSQRRGACHALL
jgi:hypothetical protein